MNLEDEVVALRAEVERLKLIGEGRCPICREVVRGWSVPVGSFAPEMWATLREHGVDPVNGHKAGCTFKAFRG